jgi:hypothetical protein
MTNYTFVPSSLTPYVYWSDASLWSGGVAPNAPDADVVIPLTTQSTGISDFCFISLMGVDAVNSLSIQANDLIIQGSLTIGGGLSLLADGQITLGGGGSSGTLAMGSGANSGYISGAGAITCAGAFLNDGFLEGSGLAFSAASLDNASGVLETDTGGDLTVTVTPGGFANLTRSTLTGGTYYSGSSDNFGSQQTQTLYFNVGGAPSVDAANIEIDYGGDIDFWDSGSGAYTPLESTLQSISTSGVLTLGQYLADEWGAVTVDGLLELDGADPTFAQLTIDPGAEVANAGSIAGPIVDNGTVVAGQDGVGGALILDGAVTGSGVVKIASDASSLELGSNFAAKVLFEDAHGTLTLDDPAGFTGTIAPTGVGDEIVLVGISLGSMTGWSYTGDQVGGVLEIDLGGSSIDLGFAGDFASQDFGFVAGPQAQASDPPSLAVVSNGPAVPAPDLMRDHFDGADVSDILIENTGGCVAVGQVSGGRESYATVAMLGPEWSFEGTGDFIGDGGSDFLIENTSGRVDVGEVANGTTTYAAVATLGPEWRFVGAGDFFGAGAGLNLSSSPGGPVGGNQDEFLIENTAGLLDLGTVANGKADFTQIDQLASDWKVLGAGAYLGDGRTQFLMQNASGVVEVGDVVNEKAVDTQVAALGPEWTYVGSGDVLNDGRAQFLIENTAGRLAAAEIGSDGLAQYTTLAGLGPEWTIESVGDYLGDGYDQFVMENTSGAVVVGDWSGGQIHWTTVGGLGPEWKFRG